MISGERTTKQASNKRLTGRIAGEEKAGRIARPYIVTTGPHAVSGVIGRVAESFCRHLGSELHRRHPVRPVQSSHFPPHNSHLQLSIRPPQCSTWSRIPMEYLEERDLISPFYRAFVRTRAPRNATGKVGRHGSSSALWRGHRGSPGTSSRPSGETGH